jgi:hypothetical protein
MNITSPSAQIVHLEGDVTAFGGFPDQGHS